MRDKQGNKLTFKEFMSRWKEGIEMITPLQTIKHQIRGYRITLIGLLCGIGVSIYAYKTMWWLGIILIGGLYINLMQYLGLRTQKKQMEKWETQ